MTQQSESLGTINDLAVERGLVPRALTDDEKARLLTDFSAMLDRARHETAADLGITVEELHQYPAVVSRPTIGDVQAG